MNERSNGSMFCGAFAWLTALVFVVLKLTGVIGWSWLWVLSPLWIVYGGVIAFLLVALTAFALTEVLNELSR